MKALPAGILLPSDILEQPWFGVFGLFVALNTIIYLGLTAAKFVPWPAQVHPSRVRGILITDNEEVSTMPNAYRSALRDLQEPSQDLRDDAARQTIPMALALVGALTAIVALVYILLYFDTSGPLLLLGPVYGFILIVVSLILARSRAGATTMRVTWALLMLALIVENCWRAALLDSAVPLAYSLVTLSFLAPIALSWRVGVLGAIAGTVPITLGGYGVSVVDTFSWGLASVTAALGSLVLLYLRIASLDSIAEERMRADALATTDPVTGAFSRVGILSLAPAFAEAAELAHKDVTVVLCDIVGMRGLNADYGWEYGDDALRATSRALRASLPEGSLVGRWGGDGFLGLVSGNAPGSQELSSTLDAALVNTGVALGKRPVRLHVGTASGRPGTVTLEELVLIAARQIDDTTQPTG